MILLDNQIDLKIRIQKYSILFDHLGWVRFTIGHFTIPIVKRAFLKLIFLKKKKVHFTTELLLRMLGPLFPWNSTDMTGNPMIAHDLGGFGVPFGGMARK